MGNSILTRQNVAYEDVSETIRDFNRRIKESTDDREKQDLEEQRNVVSRTAAMANTRAAFVNVTNALTGGVSIIMPALSGFGRALETSFSSMVNSNSGIEAAGAILKSFTSLGGEIIKGMLGILGSIGTALQGLGPMGALAGGAIKGISAAGQAAIGAIVTMANMVTDMVVKAVQSVSQAFFRAASVGGVFANGMNDLASMAQRTGLSISSFARVFETSAQSLANTGISVSKATRTVVDVMSFGGGRLKSSLFGLGISLEDQAGVVADTMASMTAYGSPFSASAAETEAATREYAKNLRFLASYTGEDLKKKMEEANQQKKYLIVQQKLLEMDEGQRTLFMQKFSTLDKQMQRNVIDVMATGQVINESGAQMVGFNSRYGTLVQDITGGLMDAGRGMQDFARISAQAGPELIRSFAGDQTMQVAQLLGVGLAENLGQFGVTMGNLNEVALRNAAEETNKAATQMSGLTSSVYSANIALEKFKSDIEQKALPLASTLASLLDPMTKLMGVMTDTAVGAWQTITKFMIDHAPKLADVAKTALEGANKAADNSAVLGSVIQGALSGAAGGGAIGSLFGPGLGTGIGAVIGAVAGGSAAYLQSPPSQRALGGPVMPGATYLVGEQGPEFLRMGSSGTVTPNNQIAGSLDADRRANAIATENFINIMREQLAVNKEMLAETREVRSSMNEVRGLQQTLVTYTT